VLPPGLLQTTAALGVLLYAGVGMETIFLGGNFLDYNELAHDPVHGQHLGILLVEAGVGITVASVMLLLYYAFAGRGTDR
jgi:multicomponent Na+:H+ antiporter subunit B